MWVHAFEKDVVSYNTRSRKISLSLTEIIPLRRSNARLLQLTDILQLKQKIHARESWKCASLTHQFRHSVLLESHYSVVSYGARNYSTRKCRAGHEVLPSCSCPWSTSTTAERSTSLSTYCQHLSAETPGAEPRGLHAPKLLNSLIGLIARVPRKARIEIPEFFSFL